MYRYVTPDEVINSPVGCRTIRLPDYLFHLVSGALHTLTQESSYEELGDMSPAAVAEIMQDMFDTYLSGSVCMVGQIVTWASANLPLKHVECDGSLLYQADYPELFEVLGDTYGLAPGGRFRLPNFKGVLLRGSLDGGVANPIGYLEDTAVGDSVGTQSVNLSTDNLPRHTHQVQKDIFIGVPAQVGGGAASMLSGSTIVNTLFNDTALDPVQIEPPAVAVKFLIRVLP